MMAIEVVMSPCRRSLAARVARQVIQACWFGYFPPPYLPQTAGLLRHMNGLGIRDGISHGLDQSVDGMPLQVHLDKLDQIRAVTLDM